MPLENANDEQLVIDLASDYSDRIISGQTININEYLDKLPNEASRREFKAAANMTRLIATIHDIKQQEIGLIGEPASDEIIPVVGRI